MIGNWQESNPSYMLDTTSSLLPFSFQKQVMMMMDRRCEDQRDDEETGDDLGMKIILWRYLTEERSGAAYPDIEDQGDEIL